MAEEAQPKSRSLRERRLDRTGLVCGFLLTILVNGAVLTTILVARSHGAVKPGSEVSEFVDAKLVRFGKPRDLSFLPHVQASPKQKVEKKTIKLSQDPDRPSLPRTPDDNEKPSLTKLSSEFRNLRDDEDDRATEEAATVGSPTGIRGGDAEEASGDPFILAVKGAITERWTVPSLISPAELAKLHAGACLQIDDEGRLVKYAIKESSKNAEFDGSLLATLGSIQTLVKPFGKYASYAKRGKLCLDFSKE